ncbi:hypothetical protein ACM39_03745 [Chryseobacterium sp. FH2]|uniref:hypothetical protein n=1 Tax=Chryseobacterium sp. FH2 TaxID=1674291 RepID=UPI00065AC3CE|nr:hypothetical protein [Chryseobacterium sp. FH2]KMQ69224.1 hypothetical protein ACM39_03745 [Chryseobacterium sp. FH2]
MKKILLAAAFGVAGIVSAKDAVKNEFGKKAQSENLKKTEFCIKPTKKIISNIKVMTSCGLPAYITWDTDWGIECLMSDAAAADYLTCAP